MIATNLDWPKDVVVKWYDARGEYSENRIKELKIGFSMERMPSSYFKANAVFFRIGVLAYNLFRIFQLNILPKEYKKHQIKTIRWKLYNIAGRIVYHSRKVFLKVKIMPILYLRRCATRFLYFAAIVHKKGFCLLDEIILR